MKNMTNYMRLYTGNKLKFILFNYDSSFNFLKLNHVCSHYHREDSLDSPKSSSSSTALKGEYGEMAGPDTSHTYYGILSRLWQKSKQS